MTQFALIRASDGLWLSGPLDEEPVAAEGEYVVIVNIGYPAGCLWDPTSQGFRDIVVPPAPPSILSPLAYQRRFTAAERIAIRGSADPLVVDWLALSMIAATIDLADADVIAGTHYLESLGLIAAGRAIEILTA